MEKSVPGVGSSAELGAVRPAVGGTRSGRDVSGWESRVVPVGIAPRSARSDGARDLPTVPRTVPSWRCGCRLESHSPSLRSGGAGPPAGSIGRSWCRQGVVAAGRTSWVALPADAGPRAPGSVEVDPGDGQSPLPRGKGWFRYGGGPNGAGQKFGDRVCELFRGPTSASFPALKVAFQGRRPSISSTSRPGRSSKPHSGSGSIRLRALLDGRGTNLLPSLRACSRGDGRFTKSRRNLRRTAITVPSGCVVSAPLLGLSPGGFPPAPVVPGVGTFLSRVPLPDTSTVSCPLPPGRRD